MIQSNRSTDWWREFTYLTRYAGSGVLNTIVGFVVIFSAMSFGFTPMISNVAGYCVGFMLGFVLSKKFVFRSNGHFVGESMRYLAAFLVCFLINIFVLFCVLNVLHWNALLAQVTAAIAYTCSMYVFTRFIVFSNRA